MDTEITENMVMLGKIVGFPKWPCVILNELDCEEGRSQDENESYKVQFFNDGQFAWLTKKDLSSYEDNKNIVKKFPKDKKLLGAIRDADYQLSIKSANPDHYITATTKRKRQSLPKNVQSKRRKGKNVKKNDTERHITKHEIQSELVTDERENKTIGMVVGEELLAPEIITKLSQAGYSINLYDVNRDKSNFLGKKFKSFLNVKFLLSARSVLKNSNTIFLYLCDEKQLRDIILTDFGIGNSKDHLLQNKGVINMTNVSPHVSEELSKLIETNGGKYLDLCIQGSRTNASERTLVFLASGNFNLYEENIPCFEATGVTSYFINGVASRVNLILQMIKAVNLAALGASFTLSDSIGLSRDIFAHILESTNLSSGYIKNKVTVIKEKSFSNTDEAIDQMQQQLKWCVEMANNMGRPIPFANTINSMYQRHAVKYDGYDSSVISMWNNNC